MIGELSIYLRCSLIIEELPNLAGGEAKHTPQYQQTHRHEGVLFGSAERSAGLRYSSNRLVPQGPETSWRLRLGSV